jgi:hypothetical protein
MSIKIDVPPALRAKVHDKLVASGALERIDRRVRHGMCAAIETLRGDKSPKPVFESLGFNKPAAELKSIQVVYKYLGDVGLTWTLDTLVQETNLRPADTSDPSLLDLLANPSGAIADDEEDEAD